MNEIIKGLSLGTLLRQFFAGVFFIGAVWFQTIGANLPPWVNDLEYLLVFAPLIALTIGTLLYAFSRCFLNVIIEKVRYCLIKTADSWFYRFFFIGKKEREALKTRWRRAAHTDLAQLILRKNYDAKNLRNRTLKCAEKYLEKEKFNSSMTQWADYIHLLYTTSIALFFGTLIGSCDPNASKTIPEGPIYWIAGVLLLIGLISDIRRHIMELEI